MIWRIINKKWYTLKNFFSWQLNIPFELLSKHERVIISFENFTMATKTLWKYLWIVCLECWNLVLINWFLRLWLIVIKNMTISSSIFKCLLPWRNKSMLDEPFKSSWMKSKPINDDVETCSLLMNESLNNWSNNTTNLFFKSFLASSFISSFSLDDDELELFEWCEGFCIRISIITKNNIYETKI